MIAVAILAAGQGQRFGRRPLPKQFETIAGKPVFVYSVELYRGLESVGPLLLVAHPELIDETAECLVRFGCADGVTVVAGGETRRASIANAVHWLMEHGSMADDDSIILQNAASPNTREELVRRCIEVARNADAVQAYMPELRTVFAMESDTVSSVLRRGQHAVSCDPTIYRFHVLREALDSQSRFDLPGDATTDIVS
ncbi:MAG: 2-C-methyl-D-erythritol 4-phosphate cytidylyltransferase, partial [Gammaproteobacteria bacterium]|nr:2-C-methyl-D-erythritol 4-phosphate cytidylyltransferase [Gammaproteobacteria bacterium]